MAYTFRPPREALWPDRHGFQVCFFCFCVFLRRPHGLADETSPPTRGDLLKTTSTGEGWRLGCNREGRRTENAQQSRKKKTMKTNTQNKSGLGSRSAQLSSNSSTTTAQTAPVAQPQKPDNRLPIDAEARKKNRMLATPKVLNLLLTGLPDVYRLAEVVGKWVWVTFKEQPTAEIRQKLAEFGFHWNRERQAWQHPCGQFRLSSQTDPHEKYSSYFPADARPA